MRSTSALGHVRQCRRDWACAARARKRTSDSAAGTGHAQHERASARQTVPQGLGMRSTSALGHVRQCRRDWACAARAR
ncbi:hypothetical protein NDU88_000195 [Pleurodeles waltl]|uniref:Uncharacterized protein n=1 Tax=Pleurodeles waltl TaxID=8319 RepID=A0AAV7P3G2_PLEWA|nr:hypothetical protein NDU88_000195 [Pleurodeles waltl]